jgi:hypothetical protein
MHAGGGTNDRWEKRNVLIVSVLLLIGSDAAQQYAEARLCPEDDATVRHFLLKKRKEALLRDKRLKKIRPGRGLRWGLFAWTGSAGVHVAA